MVQSFCEMVIQQKQAANIDQSPPQEMSIQDMEDLKQHYLDEIQSIKENVKIYSNPLFEFDDEYIFSYVNPLFDEVLENIESKDSYVSNLDEPALLVTPFFDANEDECFDPSGNVDEIEFLLHHNTSTLKLSVASILEGFTDKPSLEENDDLFNLESKENEWKRILYDAPIDDLMTEDKIPSGEIKVHIEVLSVLWGNKLPIPDGSLPLSRSKLKKKDFEKVKWTLNVGRRVTFFSIEIMSNKNKQNNRSNKRNVKLPNRYNDHVMSNVSKKRSNSEHNKKNDEIRVNFGGNSKDSNDLMNNKLGEEALKTGDLNARYEDISVANKRDDYDFVDLSSEEYVLMNDKDYLDDVSQVDKLNEISSENIEETRLNENEADRFKTSPIKSYAHVAMNSETSLNNQLRSIPTVLNDSGEEVVVFDEEMVKIVAAKSPWMVNGKPLVVYKWDPSIGLDKVEPKPEDSLRMGGEHLDTIPATESDEFIKSSADNLVPTPSESEGASNDFTSSDESFSEEDVPNENFKIFSNTLFDLDEEITSTKVDQIDDEINDSQKIDSLLDEFVGELTLLKSIPPGIDDDNLDPEEFNYENPTESFSPSTIPVEDSDSLMEEIDIFLDDDGSIPPGIESDNFDSEDDDNSHPEFESFHVDYPDSGDSTIDVVEDIPVDVPNILPTHPALQLDFNFIPSLNDLGSDLDVSYPSGDSNKIYDLGICIEVESMRFLSTLSPVINTLLPFSFENKDKVFNHGVLVSKEKYPSSPSHRGLKAL
ncbi:hypothetical protein Tco_0863920 [Tanacetum coccineum]